MAPHPPAKIDSFRGTWKAFSNFFQASLEVEVWEERRQVATVEQGFQLAKVASSRTPVATRRAMAQVALALEAPAEAKSFGKRIPALAMGEWEARRLPLMEALLSAKFTQHPELMELLLATGETPLEEGNTWGDTYWGVCRGRGENHLGRLLMALRAEEATRVATGVLLPGTLVPELMRRDGSPLG